MLLIAGEESRFTPLKTTNKTVAFAYLYPLDLCRRRENKKGS
jgi:hypothetical protein